MGYSVSLVVPFKVLLFLGVIKLSLIILFLPLGLKWLWFLLQMWYGRGVMSEENKDFDQHADEALSLAKPPVGADIDALQEGAARSRTMVNEPEAEGDRKTTGRKVIAGTIIGAAAMGGAYAAVDAVANAADAHFQHVDEQNRKWADEQQQREQELDDGLVHIDLGEQK